MGKRKDRTFGRDTNGKQIEVRVPIVGGMVCLRHARHQSRARRQLTKDRYASANSTSPITRILENGACCMISLIPVPSSESLTRMYLLHIARTENDAEEEGVPVAKRPVDNKEYEHCAT